MDTASISNSRQHPLDHIPIYYKQPNSPVHFPSEWTEHSSRLDIARSPFNNKMATVTQTALVEESPKRYGLNITSTTPIKPQPVAIPNKEKLVSTKPASPKLKNVKSMDVLWAMLNDVMGKDKMAKFGQYTLRLLLHYSARTRKYLSDDKVNIKVINETYQSRGKLLTLFGDFLRNPRAFARVLIILVCSVFTSRFSAMAPALGLYRQILRFGKTPFRINTLIGRLKQNLYHDSKTNSWHIDPKLWTKANLSELIGLYYNFNDELMLLFKLNFLHNKTWRLFSSKHESYAWYCDSWLAMYNAYNNLQRLSQQEMDMKIQIQVRRRARNLSKQVLGGNSLLSSFSLEDDAADSQALKEIQFKITNVKLDIYKTLLDIIFNSYTVFGVALHFDTIQIWMGISASLLASIKLFREKRRLLAGGI